MLNRIILIGRLVADPDFRVTTSGIPVSTFRIAVNRNFKNAQGEMETDFINIVVWRKQAELLSKWLNKGRLVAVDGRLQIRNYQTQEGQNRSISEVVAERVQLLDKPRGQGSEQQAPPPSESPGGNAEGFGQPDMNPEQTDDDLPF